MTSVIRKYIKKYGMQFLRVILYSLIMTALYLVYLFSYGIPATQDRLEEVGILGVG